MGVGGQCHAPAALPPAKETRYPLYQEAGWFPGPVWTDVKSLASTWIWSPDRGVRSEQLYLLNYPGPPKQPDMSEKKRA
jgi:hypothetical protein